MGPERTEGLSDAIAAHIVGTRFEDVPEAAIRSAERSLLDAVGVMLGASGIDDPARTFVDLVLSEAGAEQATVLGSARRVPAAAAAFANGALAHALDFEDSIDTLPVHPNAQVIPAVLALAESEGLSGARLLTAIAVGCDLAARVAAAAGHRMSERGWYPPPIAGAIGATGAAANLLGLDHRQTLDAFSLAISQTTASGEIKFSPQSVLRGVRDAFPATVAVRSVQLARAGIRGFDRPFEGTYGFFMTFTGGEYDVAAMLDGLGTRFAGEEVSFKPWPSCRGTHAFVEAALHLLDGVDSADVASIRLDGPPVTRMLAEPRAGKIAPTAAIDAKFSLPFTVASAVLQRDITLDSFSPAALAAPETLELAARVDFDVEPAYADLLTAGRTTITLTDGRTLTHEVRTPRGSLENPISEQGLIDKFTTLAGVADLPMDAATAARAADTLLGFRRVADVRVTMEDLFAAGAPR
jgi:2-methylcitrate dehydratase PrpD